MQGSDCTGEVGRVSAPNPMFLKGRLYLIWERKIESCKLQGVGEVSTKPSDCQDMEPPGLVWQPGSVLSTQPLALNIHHGPWGPQRAIVFSPVDPQAHFSSKVLFY